MAGCLAGLATVIGMKYASPSDGIGTFKVEYFVDGDEHRALVDKAALH